jgi:hypothetical protein
MVDRLHGRDVRMPRHSAVRSVSRVLVIAIVALLVVVLVLTLVVDAAAGRGEDIAFARAGTP